MSSDYPRYLSPKLLARAGSLELRARLIVEGLLSGQHRSPFQGSSVEFAQHRPYAQGDDIRKVDWKVLARSNKVYLKQYQEETNLELMVVVDCSQSMAFGTVKTDAGLWTKYDCATSIAAAMAYLATRQQDAVGLAVFDQTVNRFFRPSNQAGQWRMMIDELQAVPRWSSTGLGKVLDELAQKIVRRSVILLVSDCFDDVAAIKTGLTHLRYRNHEVMLLQTLDPAEVGFPYDSVTMFQGLEDMGEVLVEPKALRAAYLKELAEHNGELARVCRGMGVDYAMIDTGEPLDVSLSAFLARRLARMK
jgi:uncharacterized protein (DUF58 family)